MVLNVWSLSFSSFARLSCTASCFFLRFLACASISSVLKVVKCQPFYKCLLAFPLFILSMIPCLHKTFLCKKWFVFFKMFTPEMPFTLISPQQDCSTDVTVEVGIFLTDQYPLGWHLSVWNSRVALSLWLPRHHFLYRFWKKIHFLSWSSFCTKSAIFVWIVFVLLVLSAPKKTSCFIRKSLVAHFFHSICFNHSSVSLLVLDILIL